MTIAERPKKQSNNYRKVFEAALRLSPDEQRRLSDELARYSTIHLAAPSGAKDAKRAGQSLAKQVRTELAAAGELGSLDETMKHLRGREWSS
ncbi:MAG: hypothetical protein AB1846_06605 [Chloroflexota bacterium]